MSPSSAARPQDSQAQRPSVDQGGPALVGSPTTLGHDSCPLNDTEGATACGAFSRTRQPDNQLCTLDLPPTPFCESSDQGLAFVSDLIRNDPMCLFSALESLLESGAEDMPVPSPLQLSTTWSKAGDEYTKVLEFAKGISSEDAHKRRVFMCALAEMPLESMNYRRLDNFYQQEEPRLCLRSLGLTPLDSQSYRVPDEFYRFLLPHERELALTDPALSFRKSVSRHADAVRQVQATHSAYRRMGKGHLPHGPSQDLTKALSDILYKVPSGLQEALPRGAALLVHHATQDPRLTPDQQLHRVKADYALVSQPPSSSAYRPQRHTKWPGRLKPDVYKLNLVIMSNPDRSQSDTIYTEQGAPPAGTFSCDVNIQDAADELLHQLGHGRACTHLIIPTAFINEENEQEYVMVINYQDLHSRSYTKVGSDDTDGQPPIHAYSKLTSHKVDTFLNDMSMDHGDDVWYWALERLSLGGFVEQLLANLKHKRFLNRRLNNHDRRNPPTEHLASMWKLDREAHWPRRPRKPWDLNTVEPETRRIQAAYDTSLSKLCANATLRDAASQDLRSMRYQAWLLPAEATFEQTDSVPTVVVDRDQDWLHALFDTGATADFVSAKIVRERSLRTRPCHCAVTLADNTSAPITQQAYLPITLVDTKGRPFAFSTWAYVLPGGAPETDIILGLPTLITKTGTVFLSYVRELVLKHNAADRERERLRSATLFSQLAGDSDSDTQASTTEPERVGSGLPTAHACAGPNMEAVVVDDAQVYAPDAEYPFAVAVDADFINPAAVLQAQADYMARCEEFTRRHDAALLMRTWKHLDRDAREDLDTPLPVDFPEALRYGEMTHEQAEQEFFDGYSQRLGDDVKDNPDTHRIMKEHGAGAFVPQNWEGITDVIFRIQWKDSMPDSHKPKARPINPRLYEHAVTEFKRLCTYMYERHDGPWASPPTIAPKASKPFIRICGDYRWLNEHIQGQQGPIPDVRKLLDRIAAKRYVIDADLANAFHQIRLDADSSSKLSLQTPWGQFAPRFLPEGVKPGSHQLQKVVSDIFADFGDDVIVAFDNLLLLCDSVEHGNELLERLLKRCKERNVFLKLSKTNIMVKECNFFGYKITCADDNGRKGSIAISDEKRAQIDAMPFPTNIKQMRSFIGSTVYYSNFIPHYSSLMAPMVEMTTEKFKSWDDDTIMASKRESFKNYKDALAAAMFLAYPDYSLPWTLRTDASQYGVGAVLFQTRTLPDGTLVHEPLHFVSSKFSDEATRWSTIEQECYAIYFAMRNLEYYLWGKPIVIETDHNNLQYMEMSVVPKIVRWRIYIQSFMTMIKHIPGKLNQTADYLSRMFATAAEDPLAEVSLFQALLTMPFVSPPDVDPYWEHDNVSEWIDLIRALPVHQLCERASPEPSLPAAAASDVPPENATPMVNLSENFQEEGEKAGTSAVPKLSDMDMCSHVHNARRGHMGAQRTWIALQKYFPGHSVPYEFVADFVRECSVCQKFRLARTKAYYPSDKRIIPVEHPHSSIGIDHIDMAKDDDNGNRYILVVRVHYSGLVKFYPVKNKDAETTARTLLKFYASYGIFDTLRCDQGADYTSTVIKQLHKWFGIPVHYSIIRRHESSGVEHINHEIRRHTSILLATEGLYGKWSDDTVLPLVEFLINNTENMATGKKPFELHFGSSSAAFHRLSETEQLADAVPDPVDFLSNLNDNLQKLRAQALKAKHEYQAETLKLNKIPQSSYQPGDFVLYDAMSLEAARDKNKHARWLGPYKVLSQKNNDVKCEELLADKTHLFHVDSLKLFSGSLDQAKQMAQHDDQQFQVVKVHAHCGDQNTNRLDALKFLVEYTDGDIVLRDYSKDLVTCQPFLDYCRREDRKYLLKWSYPTVAEFERYQAELDSTNTCNVPWTTHNRKCYVNLAVWNTGGWYDGLRLPGQFDPLDAPYNVSWPFKTFWYEARILHPTKHRKGKPYDYVVPLFKAHKQSHLFAASSFFVQSNLLPELPPGGVLVDEAFAKLHPQVLSP
jgi:RNase H-like domain found in reverse transcriptase/Reverse transcriptase (RNA-dependent DNA polymerase)